jgi:hypothetical protein
MAHQTSKTSQKRSTPHSMGRLMDADFFGDRTSILPSILVESLEQLLGCHPTLGQLIKSRGFRCDCTQSTAAMTIT